MNRLHVNISEMEEIAKFYEKLKKHKKSDLTKYDISRYLDLEHPAELKLVFYIFSLYFVKFSKFSLSEEDLKVIS